MMLVGVLDAARPGLVEGLEGAGEEEDGTLDLLVLKTLETLGHRNEAVAVTAPSAKRESSRFP